MKRILFLVLILNLINFADCTADYFQTGTPGQRKTSQRAGESSTDEEYLVFGYCSDIDNSLGVKKNRTQLAAAIEIPASTSQTWGNAVIKKVRIGFGTAAVKDVTVYLSETLDGSYVYSQEATLTQEDGWNEVVLEQPYPLNDKGIFVGYSLTTNSSLDLPIGIDGVITDLTLGDHVCVNGTWENIGKSYGNVCIQAVVDGDNLPTYDVQVLDVTIPGFIQPEVPFAANISVINNGVKTIRSADVACKLNGEAVENFNVSLVPEELTPGRKGIIVVDNLVCDSPNVDIPFEVTVTKLNGEDDIFPSDNSGSVLFSCYENGFSRNILVEEWTGTWCGWCPRGIVGMNYMKETYGDHGFIGIAVHSSDEMQCSAYQPFLNTFENGYGYPGCVADRTRKMDPSKETLIKYYSETISQPTFANIEVSAEDATISDPNIKVTGTITFKIPMEGANLRVAFALTEDNVGPYVQQNYFAGGAAGYMDGWGTYDKYHFTTFNEVARTINSALGVANCLPSSIKANQEYTVNASLPLGGVNNLYNCTIVGMIINGDTGEIVNSGKLELGDKEDPKDPDSSVDSTLNPELKIAVLSDSIAIIGDYDSCKIYGIDGRLLQLVAHKPVIELPAGLYQVVLTEKNGNIISKRVLIK